MSSKLCSFIDFSNECWISFVKKIFDLFSLELFNKTQRLETMTMKFHQRPADWELKVNWLIFHQINKKPNYQWSIVFDKHWWNQFFLMNVPFEKTISMFWALIRSNNLKKRGSTCSSISDFQTLFSFDPYWNIRFNCVCRWSRKKKKNGTNNNIE